MGNKVSYALNKCKIIFIIVLILWLLVSIVLIMPGSIALVDAKSNGPLDTDLFAESISQNFGKVFSNFGKVFSDEYRSTFMKGEVVLILGLLTCGAIGIIKTLPKNEYSDIEHGSSDWATGEKYAILNKNKGIILAEKHYLPVDKRGNVNVLVVGRIWCW